MRSVGAHPVAASTGMSVEIEQWRFLAHSVMQGIREHEMLEHICKIAGMKGVAVRKQGLFL